MKWEAYPGLSRRPNVTTTVLISGRGRQEKGSEKAVCRGLIAGFEDGSGGHQPKNVGSL